MPSMKRPTAAAKPDMSAAYRAHATKAAQPIKKTTIELPLDLYKRLMREKLEQDTTLKDLIVTTLETAYPEP